jgi:2-polyprenyl-3-methyl-5-hydroxy-6-metoxy-1,4-benzoquinol methylase
MTRQKKNTYFANRNVEEGMYAQYDLPKYLYPYFQEQDKDLNILDIGCGLGQFLGNLKSKGFKNLHGVDINEESIVACRNNGLAVEQIGDIREYALRSTIRFDRIVMSHVLEHIDKELIIDTLIHIRKYLLKEGGVFLLMVPNAQSYTGTYWRYEDFTHTIIFTAGSCLYVLKAAGFTNIEFIDPLGTIHLGLIKRIILKQLIAYHRFRENIWNKILQTSFHKPSPRIYSFELKVAAS